jgi:hypothetical protein
MGNLSRPQKKQPEEIIPRRLLKRRMPVKTLAKRKTEILKNRFRRTLTQFVRT